MAYEDLYQTRTSRRSWIDGITKECRSWLDGLADHIAARRTADDNGEPVWEQVHEHLRRDYPDDAPKTVGTVRDAVRRMVRERG